MADNHAVQSLGHFGPTLHEGQQLLELVYVFVRATKSGIDRYTVV